MPAPKPALVALGDSLTQGFQSGAIHKTAWSFPSIIARALGLDVPLDHRIPRIPGPGLPLNLEDLLRVVHEKLGSKVSAAEWILKFPRLAHDYLDDLEDYYERRGGSLPAGYRGIYHNLAVWGFTVYESTSITSALCEKVIRKLEGWIDDDFLGIPSAPMYRTAKRVLNPGDVPGRRRESQVATLARLASEETIDALILWLGANDCLGTVLTLEVSDMEGAGAPIPADPVKRLDWNLTSLAQFEKDYRALAAAIRSALAGQTTKVFVATVPHVTIPPITRGIGAIDGSYFPHYARFFMRDESFRPALHKHLTKDEARTIDARIDGFNATIRAVAKAESQRPNATLQWHVVDTCDLLDQLAVRRNNLSATPGEALRRYYARQGITQHPLLDLDPVPSILMLSTDESGRRTGGGLFSLDGVHPSTIGYGVIAEAFLAEMQRAGIRLADPARLPWNHVIANDALLQNPPKVWDDVVALGSEHATLWDLIFRALA